MFNLPAGSPYGKVSVSLVVATGLAIRAFFTFIVTQGLRVQKARPVTGADSLIGRVGAVRTTLDPDETVWVTGELWTAVADDGPLAAEEQVEVVAVEGLRLRVRRSTGEEQ